nr:MAG TPA: hypothetical protein [Caudoviricetes sp.]
MMGTPSIQITKKQESGLCCSLVRLYDLYDCFFSILLTFSCVANNYNNPFIT